MYYAWITELVFWSVTMFGLVNTYSISTWQRRHNPSIEWAPSTAYFHWQVEGSSQEFNELSLCSKFSKSWNFKIRIITLALSLRLKWKSQKSPRISITVKRVLDFFDITAPYLTCLHDEGGFSGPRMPSMASMASHGQTFDPLHFGYTFSTLLGRQIKGIEVEVINLSWMT